MSHGSATKSRPSSHGTYSCGIHSFAASRCRARFSATTGSSSTSRSMFTQISSWLRCRNLRHRNLWALREDDREANMQHSGSAGALVRALYEAATDQDLHGRRDIGQGAVNADLVAGDAEPAQVVEGHRSRAAAQRDRPDSPEVEGDPELRAVRQVHVAHRN